MTIIHLMIGLSCGGAEQFVLELSKHHQRQGNKVIVIAITPANAIGRKFQENDIQTHCLLINSLRHCIKGFKTLLKILRREEAVVVHAHMFHAVMLMCAARFFMPWLKVVFTLHNCYVKEIYRRLLLFFTRGLRQADVVFADDTRLWYLKPHPVVIPNGIDVSKFNAVKQAPRKFTCLFLGRLAEEKNPLYLVDLVLKLKDKYNFQVDVAGDGDLKELLMSAVKAHELENWFNFLGVRNDVPHVLASAHCLVMPSLWEGMPIAILEAGASGLPIVATPVGSIPQVLNEGNAFLAPLENFHLKVEEVIRNYGIAKFKSNRLKNLIRDRYNITLAAQEHLELYGTLVERNRVYIKN